MASVDGLGWVQIWAQRSSLVTTRSFTGRYGDCPRPRQCATRLRYAPTLKSLKFTAPSSGILIAFTCSEARMRCEDDRG
jgi:hypothetical protein